MESDYNWITLIKWSNLGEKSNILAKKKNIEVLKPNHIKSNWIELKQFSSIYSSVRIWLKKILNQSS